MSAIMFVGNIPTFVWNKPTVAFHHAFRHALDQRDGDFCMDSRTVIFRQADPEVADALKAIITRDMAEKLAAECFDLSDDAAVIRVLSSTFGARSVAALWEAARDLARQAPPSGTRH